MARVRALLQIKYLLCMEQFMEILVVMEQVMKVVVVVVQVLLDKMVPVRHVVVMAAQVF